MRREASFLASTLVGELHAYSARNSENAGAQRTVDAEQLLLFLMVSL